MTTILFHHAGDLIASAAWTAAGEPGQARTTISYQHIPAPDSKSAGVRRLVIPASIGTVLTAVQAARDGVADLRPLQVGPPPPAEA